MNPTDFAAYFSSLENRIEQLEELFERNAKSLVKSYDEAESEIISTVFDELPKRETEEPLPVPNPFDGGSPNLDRIENIRDRRRKLKEQRRNGTFKRRMREKLEHEHRHREGVANEAFENALGAVSEVAQKAVDWFIDNCDVTRGRCKIFEFSKRVDTGREYNCKINIEVNTAPAGVGFSLDCRERYRD